MAVASTRRTSRRTSRRSSLLEVSGDNFKTPKKITDKLDLLDKKLDGFYRDVYTSRLDSMQNLDNVIDNLDSALDKLQTEDESLSGMTRLLQRIDSKNNNTMNKLVNSVEDLFTDNTVVSTLMYNEEMHRYIVAENKLYDTLCKYIPRLQDALEMKRDNVLCSDNFAKNFINPISNKSNKEDQDIFSANCKRLDTEYSFSEFIDKTWMNTAKYGEDFIYIVPYNVGFQRLIKRVNFRANNNLGNYRPYFESAGNVGGSEVIVEDNFVDTREFEQFKQLAIDEYGYDISDDDKRFKGFDVTVNFNETGMISEYINETAIAIDKRQEAKVRSLSEEFQTITEGKINFNSGKFDGLTQAAGGRDGLILNNDYNMDPDKIDKDFSGAILERLPRENVIPMYIEKMCIGYIYMEFPEDPTACGYCGGHHQTPGISNGNAFGYQMSENQQELALRYISAKISQAIDVKFINANKDIKEEIYAVLRYNEKFDISRSNQIGITFIPADDVIHCYFEQDEVTKRGISMLKKAVIPGMMYILLYLTDIIGKITRSTDKRIYYVKQNVEQNVARTMLNVVNQIKKGNMGMRQIESMNNILNIVGQYNDYIIPQGPSGDPPIQFEVMSGQNIETPTDIMEKMEESAINTIMPFELVNASYQQDFAIRYSMSNVRLLKDLYTLQRKTESWISPIFTRVYNYEFEENNRYIKVVLPPPTYLTMNNNKQLIDNISQMADTFIEINLSNKSDEVKNEFKRIYINRNLSTYFNYDELNEMIELAEVEAEINKPAATEDGEESNNYGSDDVGDYV